MSDNIEIPVEEVVAPTRKRGRPSKAETDLREKVVNIEAGAAKPATTKPARNGKRKPASQEELATSAKNIQGLHVMLSMMTGAPELTLDDSEAIAMAGALEKVSQEYGLALDGKTGAFIQLAGTAAVVYVPRVLAIRQRQARVAAEARAFEEIHGAASPTS